MFFGEDNWRKFAFKSLAHRSAFEWKKQKNIVKSKWITKSTIILGKFKFNLTCLKLLNSLHEMMFMQKRTEANSIAFINNFNFIFFSFLTVQLFFLLIFSCYWSFEEAEKRFNVAQMSCAFLHQRTVHLRWKSTSKLYFIDFFFVFFPSSFRHKKK